MAKTQVIDTEKRKEIARLRLRELAAKSAQQDGLSESDTGKVLAECAAIGMDLAGFELMVEDTLKLAEARALVGGIAELETKRDQAFAEAQRFAAETDQIVTARRQEQAGLAARVASFDAQIRRADRARVIVDTARIELEGLDLDNFTLNDPAGGETLGGAEGSPVLYVDSETMAEHKHRRRAMRQTIAGEPDWRERFESAHAKQEKRRQAAAKRDGAMAQPQTFYPTWGDVMSLSADERADLAADAGVEA